MVGFARAGLSWDGDGLGWFVGSWVRLFIDSMVSVFIDSSVHRLSSGLRVVIWEPLGILGSYELISNGYADYTLWDYGLGGYS